MLATAASGDIATVAAVFVNVVGSVVDIAALDVCTRVLYPSLEQVKATPLS